MNDWKLYWKTAGAGPKLIIVNLAIFLITALSNAFSHLFQTSAGYNAVLSWFTLPGDAGEALFKPWTLVTHLFLHSGLWHVAFNMIMLHFGYRLFSTYFDDNRYLRVYLFSGIMGGLVFMLSVNLFPLFTQSGLTFVALGASAAVLGVLLSVCAFRPDATIALVLVGEVKLRWIGVIFVLLDLIMIPSGNEGGHLAHLGGILFGVLFAINMRKSKDITAFAIPLGNWLQQKSVKKSPLKVSYRKTSKEESAPKKDIPIQKRIDEILDKISKSGYDSLTKEEKALLFRFSNDKDLGR